MKDIILDRLFLNWKLVDLATSVYVGVPIYGSDPGSEVETLWFEVRCPQPKPKWF